MILLFIPVLVTSCQEERIIPPGPPVGDEVNLVFSISSGGGGMRSLTTIEENKIEDIDVLVFKEGYFVERATGDIITDNSSTKEFKVTLTKNNAENNYLVIIANASQDINKAGLNGTKNEVLSRITFELDSNEGDKRWPAKLDGSDKFRCIPMFGEYGPLEINETLQEKLTDISIPLYRALARVDVTNKAANFQLTSVHFYKYNTIGCVTPGSNAEWGDYPYNTDMRRVTNVTVPSTARSTTDFLEYNVEKDESVTSSIYVMEIDRTEKRDDYSNATCLVVGGKFGGESATVTYYRIDFEIIWYIWDEEKEVFKEVIIEAGIGDPLLGRSFARMLRNHVYEITITSASGPGAESPEEARNKDKKSEIEVKAAVWYNHTLNVELND